MSTTPVFLLHIVPDPAGLAAPADLPAQLPYGLEPRDVLRTVEDVHDLLHRLNSVLHDTHHEPLEHLLDRAAFSGLISRTVTMRLAAASRALVPNAYHNGYPDLIERGRYPRDRVQHGEGLEVKASRSESSWQAHGPRDGWFVVVQFALDEREDVAFLDREPTRCLAVMMAWISEEDWSWQPAAEGRIRSGTASLKPSGRLKLRRSAVWVDPTYLTEHRKILSRLALVEFRTESDQVVLELLDTLGEASVAELAARAAELRGFTEPEVLKAPIRSAVKRLQSAGTVVSPSRGRYRRSRGST